MTLDYISCGSFTAKELPQTHTDNELKESALNMVFGNQPTRIRAQAIRCHDAGGLQSLRVPDAM